MANGKSQNNLDQGYAWVILFACVCANSFQNIGTPGIFYKAILHKYDRGEYLAREKFALKGSYWIR